MPAMTERRKADREHPTQWSAGSGADLHPRPSTPSPLNARTGGPLAALAVSIVFTVLLVTAPEHLDTAWRWIGDLPLVFEVVAWVALLPWLLAYLAWQASWELWLRVVAVAFLVGGVALSFWRDGSR